MIKILNAIKQHKVVTGLVILVLAGGGFYWYNASKTTAVKTSYVTAAVQKGTLTSSVSGTGQVAASNQVSINPQGSGVITAVYVKEGDKVKAGQSLAALDESSASNQINSARASLASAQANYDNVMAGNTNQDVQLAQLAVQSAQKSVDNAKTNYDQVKKQQELAVTKSYTTLLNDGLQAVPSDTQSTAPVTVTGSYTGTAPGSYTIILYLAGDGLHYQISGLSTQQGFLNRGIPQSIGNGLYITFGTTGTITSSTSWIIQIPNQQSVNYASNQTAYSTAQQNQTQALQQAVAQIDTAQNQLQQAQVQLNQKQAPPTNAQVEAARAQITSAQAQLQTAETGYANNVIKAPFDGIISTLSIQKGQQAGSGTAAAVEVAQGDIAQVSLNEVDAAKVQVGQKATLTFSAIPDLSISGQVAEVQTIGTVTQNVVNFPVKIAFDTQDPRVKPGMSVTANIITAVAQNILIAPSSAVKSNSDGSSYVQILLNGQPQQVNVTSGVTNNSDTEISGNIKEGDEVVTQTITSSTQAKTTGQTSILQSIGGGTGGAGRAAGGFGGGAGFGGGRGN